MTGAGERSSRTVATDASVLINFLLLGRSELLAAIPGFDFAVPEQVVAEITRPEQVQALATGFESGLVRREVCTEPAEIGRYADLRRVMGRGEAACLAMAEARGWCVAADEGGRFRRLARERLGEGRILNTPGILLLAIRAGRLSVEEADELKARLDEHRFKMAFRSFRDVLGS